MTRRSIAELLQDEVLEPLLPLAADVLREALGKKPKSGGVRDTALAQLLVTTTAELATKQTTDLRTIRRIVDAAVEQAGAVAATPESAGPALLDKLRVAQESDERRDLEPAAADSSPNGTAPDDLEPPG